MRPLALGAGAVVLAVTLAGSLAAQTSTCEPHLVGADRRGPAGAIARSGDTLYLASGAALVVIDVEDFLAPVELGYVNVDEVVVDVAASGPRIVVLGANGLTFVDATDRTTPEVASTLPFPESWNVRHVSAQNDRAFVPAPDGLHIVDFSDPGAPVEIGAFPGPYSNDVVVRENRAYLLTASALLVLDITDPTSPLQIGSVPTFDQAIAQLTISPRANQLVATGNGCVHVHCWFDAAFYSLSNPDLPVERSRESVEKESVGAVAISGGRAYLTDRVYDLTDLANPIYLGRLPGHWAEGLFGTPDPRYLFLADPTRGLLVEEVSDPPNAVVVAAVEMPAETTDGYMDGSLLVTAHHYGLRSFDLSDPTRPVLLGAASLPESFIENVQQVGDHAYLASESYPGSNLRIVDLADPSNPVEVGSMAWFYDRPVLDDNLLISRETCNEALTFYEVSDPAMPTAVGGVFLSADCWGIVFAADAGRLYLWDYIGGYPDYPQLLHVYDITNPATPVELAATQVPEHVGSAVARGRTVFFAQGVELRVIDLSVPVLPTVVGTMPLLEAYSGGHQRRISLYGSRLLVSSFVDPYDGEPSHPVQVVDVSRPASPTEIAVVEPLGDGRAAFAGPGVIVVADGPAGFSVYESCAPFADGFESGDASAWSATQP